MKKIILTAIAATAILFTTVPAQAAVDMAQVKSQAENTFNGFFGSLEKNEYDNYGTPKRLKDINDPANPGRKLQVYSYTVEQSGGSQQYRVNVLVTPEGNIQGSEILYLGN